MEQLSGLGGIIDAPSEEIADGLVEELKDRGVVTVGNIDKLTDGTIFMDVNLSPTSPTQRELCRFSLFSTTQVIELPEPLHAQFTPISPVVPTYPIDLAFV